MLTHFRWLVPSLAILMAQSASGDVVSLRADNWCPFNCDPKSSTPGYMIEIAKAALEANKHSVDYQTLNWARAVSETRNGAFVGIVGAARGDAEDFVFPDVTLGRSRSCFFTKADGKWQFKNLASLDTIIVGIIKDYSYEDEFDKYVATHAKDTKRVDAVGGDNPLELNYKKLQAGRIGALIEEESVLKNFMNEKKLDAGTVRNAGCVKEDDLYIAFSPKNPKSKEYAKAVTDQVNAMRKDGSLGKLLAKYGLKDWK